ncbi:type II toxin-antitoxin system VapC family toxin [Fontimonas sp. SYSU GA230001]|uniref:type II toxin-antitoxin system VapC family toxin n=1 Tax=Fontimonas sp. SYSU GA230001 TaxID=3142450 RepID=UPI0032B3C313
MSLLLDTNVLIRAERRGRAPDWSRWEDEGDAYLAAISASELLIGVHRADTDARRVRRSAWVEAILGAVPVLPFDLETARVHAQLLAAIPRGVTVGAHDMLIAATAVQHGLGVLTANVKEFARIPGLRVLELGT